MNKNNKKTKSHIKKGDTVVVLSGDSKGEQGVVQKIITAEYRAIVEGVNLVKRHVRPTAEQPGGINQKEASIHISNLMLVDADGQATRIKKGKEDGKSVRISKKTGNKI